MNRLVAVAGQTDIEAVANAGHQVTVERHVEADRTDSQCGTPAAVAGAEPVIALAKLCAGDRGLQVARETRRLAGIRGRRDPTVSGNAVVPVCTSDEVRRLERAPAFP